MAVPGIHVKGETSAPVRAAGWALGTVFKSVSRLRGAKSLHPEGVVHEGTVRIHGDGAAPHGARLFERPRELRAIVRFSRSFGLPDSLPDLLGMSLRLLDAHATGRHQDFLLVTSIDAPVLHHVFVPAGDVQQRPYSSSLPYRTPEGERFIVGAVPRGDMRFDLSVASLGGRFRAVGEIEVGDRLPQELDGLRFQPFNTGGGLELAGALNALRDYAYPLSQRGWGDRN